MSIHIVCIEVDDPDHQKALETLFIEYASDVSVSIESNIVAQLNALPYFHGFLCLDDNKPLGFAICFESFSTYRAKKLLNIHDFMIARKARGQGLGKLLLTSIEEYCRERDFLKITLEVEQDNYVAKNLYSVSGYEDFQVVLKGLEHWQKYLI